MAKWIQDELQWQQCRYRSVAHSSHCGRRHQRMNVERKPREFNEKTHLDIEKLFHSLQYRDHCVLYDWNAVCGRMWDIRCDSLTGVDPNSRAPTQEKLESKHDAYLEWGGCRLETRRNSWPVLLLYLDSESVITMILSDCTRSSRAMHTTGMLTVT